MISIAASQPPDPTDATPWPPVQWFGASQRLIGGKPDARYGWLDVPGGPCIVKEMDAGLVAYNPTLLAHERRVLCELAELDAPAPALVDGTRSDWLVTRFTGLSMRVLQCDGSFGAGLALERFPLAERLSAWAHLLKCLQPLATQGVLVLDLYDANMVLPLTQGMRGQLRLTEPRLIDHAHTLRAGMGLHRPIWLSSNTDHIPPELRQVMDQDLQTLIQEFERQQADLPGYSRMPAQRDEHNRRVWAEYHQPQRLQRRLDNGEVRCDAAMQFAVGVALQRLLGLADPSLAAALRPVIERMTAAAAEHRFASVTEAADALIKVCPKLPLVSDYHYPAFRPDELVARGATPDNHAATLKPSGIAPGEGTVLPHDVVPPQARWSPTSSPLPVPVPVPATKNAKTTARRWLYWFGLMLATGAAAGTVMPTFW